MRLVLSLSVCLNKDCHENLKPVFVMKAYCLSDGTEAIGNYTIRVTCGSTVVRCSICSTVATRS